MSSIKIVRTAEQLFGGKLIGSYLFVEDGLLDLEDVNDIDLAIQEGILGGVVNYLRDEGYTNPVGYHFHKEGQKTIQLVPHRDSFNIYTDLPQLVKVKYERASKTDLKQLVKIVSRYEKRLFE